MIGALLIATIVVLILVTLLGYWGLLVAGAVVLMLIFGLELFDPDRPRRE